MNTPTIITPQHIESLIKTVQYHHFHGTTATVCCITTHSSFTVTGTSFALNSENFKKKLGQKNAREKALEKLWDAEAYRLKAEENHLLTCSKSGVSSIELNTEFLNDRPSSE